MGPEFSWCQLWGKTLMQQPTGAKGLCSQKYYGAEKVHNDPQWTNDFIYTGGCRAHHIYFLTSEK